MSTKIQPQKSLRERLLQQAELLFTQKGYDRTTVQQVIDSLGVSKGAFYHHFSSKEDLLDAVAEKMTQEGLVKFRPILEDRTRPALERLVLYLNQSRSRRLGRMSLIGTMLRMLQRDENTIIRQKINRRAVESLRPLFAQLIADGAAEGVFKTPDPDEAAELMLQLGNLYAETTIPLMLEAGIDEQGIERIMRRILFYLDTYERLLGLESGSLPRVEKDQLKMIVNLLRASDGPSGPAGKDNEDGKGGFGPDEPGRRS